MTPSRQVHAALGQLARFYGRQFDTWPVARGEWSVGRIRGADPQPTGPPFAGGGVDVSVSNAELRITSASDGPASLYRATGPRGEAWSTHATAAALLAGGRLEIDTDVIGEYLAAQFVGGTGTLLRDVAAVEPGTELTVTVEGVVASAPDGGRWQPVAEDEAEARALQFLFEHVEKQLRERSAIWCGLTAGLDSQVAAAAATELGIGLKAFTWAWASNDAESLGAAEAAERIGIDHQIHHYHLWDETEAMAKIHEVARWSDGAAAVGFGRPAWPSEIDSFLTGGGGEVGRAFYWHWFAQAWPNPSPRRVRQSLAHLLTAPLVGARPGVGTRVRHDVDQWVTQAEDQGAHGWRALDAVYADQRMRHWGRAMMPRSGFPLVAAFGSHEISRSLSSLPASEKLRDGFHRRFLAERGLGRPDPAPQRRVPRSARRTAWAWRSRRRRLPPPVRSGLVREWQGRPHVHRWFAESVLGGALIREAMGASWSEMMQQRFCAGDAFAEQIAVWAGGPVALLEAAGDTQ